MAIAAIVGGLAALVTVIGGLAAAVRAMLKLREQRIYGPGPAQYDLTGRRVTWARRTGAADARSRKPRGS